MHSLLRNKKRIGSSVGNLHSFSDTAPSNADHIVRSQSLLSLRDASLSSSLLDWQVEKLKVDNALIEKTYPIYKKMEISIYKLAESKLILQCLQDVARNTNKKLTQDTAKKLNDIIDKWKAEKYLKLAYNDVDCNVQLLGIINMSDAELSQMEKIRIKSCIEAELQEKIEKLISIYTEEGFDLSEGMSYAENGIRDRYMKKCGFEQKSSTMEKIIELLKNYLESMAICYERMQHWWNLKMEMDNLQLQKASNLQLQARITELKAKISELVCICKMYNETSLTTEAFRRLRTLLDDKLNLIDKEIQEKKQLRKQFSDLKGTEFDVIVKQYKDLCTTIEKHKRMLEHL